MGYELQRLAAAQRWCNGRVQVWEPAMAEWAAAKQDGVGVSGHTFANAELKTT